MQQIDTNSSVVHLHTTASTSDSAHIGTSQHETSSLPGSPLGSLPQSTPYGNLGAPSSSHSSVPKNTGIAPENSAISMDWHTPSPADVSRANWDIDILSYPNLSTLAFNSTGLSVDDSGEYLATCSQFMEMIQGFDQSPNQPFAIMPQHSSRNLRGLTATNNNAFNPVDSLLAGTNTHRTDKINQQTPLARGQRSQETCVEFPEPQWDDLQTADAEIFGHVKSISPKSFESIHTFFDQLHECHDSIFIDMRCFHAFVELYFEYFDPQFPFLHHTNIDVEEPSWILLLAAATVGSQYSAMKDVRQYIAVLQDLLTRAIEYNAC